MAILVLLDYWYRTVYFNTYTCTYSSRYETRVPVPEVPVGVPCTVHCLVSQAQTIGAWEIFRQNRDTAVVKVVYAALVLDVVFFMIVFYLFIFRFRLLPLTLFNAAPRLSVLPSTACTCFTSNKDAQ